MDTFFAKNRLSAFLDGGLPDSEAAEVADAIERDPALKAEYEQLRMTVAALRQYGPVSAPEGFSARVMAAVDAEPSQSGVVVQFRRFFRRVPVEALAVAAAAMLVVFAAGSQFGGDLPSEPVVAKAPSSAQTPPTAPVVDGAPPAETRPATSPQSPEQVAAAGSADPAEPPANAAPSVLPQQAANRKGSMPAAPPSPDGAYVPGWEDGKAGAGQAFGGMEGLSLSVSDPEVMQKLYMVAESHGGRMLDEASQPLRPYSLSSTDPVARVLLLVPVDRASGLRSQLQSFGATPGGPSSSDANLAAGYSGFFLQLELVE
jgi:negative regulator of sigma E activity